MPRVKRHAPSAEASFERPRRARIAPRRLVTVSLRQPPQEGSGAARSGAARRDARSLRAGSGDGARGPRVIRVLAHFHELTPISPRSRHELPPSRAGRSGQSGQLSSARPRVHARRCRPSLPVPFCSTCSWKWHSTSSAFVNVSRPGLVRSGLNATSTPRGTLGPGGRPAQVLGVRRPRSMLVSTTFCWPTLRTAASPVLGEAPLPRRSHGRAAPSLGGPADLALVVAANATRAPPVSDRFASSDSARPDLVNRASHASPRPETEGAARQGERGADGRSLTRRSISRRQTERLRAASTLSGCTRRVTCGSPGPRCKAAARRSMSRSPLV